MADITPRTLEIGLTDYLTLDKRRAIMLSDMNIEDFRRIFKCNHKEEALQIIKWLEKGGNRKILCYGMKGFPDFSGLDKYLPYFLLAEGTVPDEGLRITVVGTRRTDWYGLHRSFTLGMELNLNGNVFATGNAEGCEQALINGAISGGNGNFITVLPCGHEVQYPYNMDYLKEKIIDNGGLIVSPFAPFTPPMKHNFPYRNQILAAMGHMCIVLQAPIKSGAMITADLAQQIGREILVAECGLGDSVNRRGTQRLYDDGCLLLGDVFDPKIKVVETKDSKNAVRFGNAYYEITPRM